MGTLYGEAYCSLGQYDEALSKIYEAKEVFDSTKDRSYPLLGEIYKTLGKVFIGKKEYSKAIGFLSKSLTEWEPMIGKDNPQVALVHFDLGRVYYQMGDFDKAINEYNAAIDIQKARLHPKHPDYMATMEAMELVNSTEMPDGLLLSKPNNKTSIRHEGTN